MDLRRYVVLSTVVKRLLSPQEYLALERQAEFKSEYYGGEMFAMAGASSEHTLVKDNPVREVGGQLKGGLAASSPATCGCGAEFPDAAGR